MWKKLSILFFSMIFVMGGCSQQNGTVDISEGGSADASTTASYTNEIEMKESLWGETDEEMDSSEIYVEETASTILFDDWDNDGIRDHLKIWNREVEGSEYLEKLELKLSSIVDVYTVEKPSDCITFDSVMCGDYDQDGQMELLLVFDIHASSKKYGFYAMDVVDGNIHNLFDNSVFSGCSYEVTLMPEDSKCAITGSDSGNSFTIEIPDSVEGDFGRVSAIYSILPVQEGGEDYIRIHQSIHGMFSTDYLGDIEITLSLEGGDICVIEEKIDVNKALED